MFFFERKKLPDNLTEIGQHAFSECKSLNKIEFPESIKTINVCAFEDCSSLKEIDLSNCPLKLIFAGTFDGCSSLKKIILPESVETIGSGAFSGCSSLESIHLPESVKKIGKRAFTGCDSLKYIEIPEGVAELDEVLYCKNLIAVSLPSTFKELHQDALGEHLKYIYIKAVTPPQWKVPTYGRYIFLVPKNSISKYADFRNSNFIPVTKKVIGVDTETFDFEQYLKDQGAL